jgi:RNA 3'-terminal phosphate cyclase (ATP)
MGEGLAFGERGVSAEQVAARAVAEMRGYLDSSSAVGEHLADQLLLPLALAGAGSFTTVVPSGHTLTNAEAIAKFLPV